MMIQKFDAKKITLFVFYIFTVLLAYISINSWVDSLLPSGSIVGPSGQYAGGDFLFFYTGAKLVLSGHINDLYTGALITGTNSLVVPELGTKSMHPWAWLYPPHYLLLILPFGLLPYYFALGLWLILSLSLLGFILWHFGGMRGGLWLATIFNVSVIYCLTIGQNSLIFAAIAGMGIYLLKKRPLLAGLCFSVLSMKPHFAILIPIALLIGRYWQVLLYTIIGTLLLVIATSFILGLDIWWIAAAHLASMKDVINSPDNRFFSIYSTYRSLLEIGLPEIYAWCGYFIIAALALYGFCKVWYREHTLATKWLAFSIAALLCSPYNLAYDAVWIVLPIMAWLSQRLTHNNKLPSFMYLLLAMQILAFVIVSLNHTLAILLIISALILLLVFDRYLDRIPN